MTDEVKAVRIPGLSRANALDLRERAGADVATLEPEPIPEGQIGDPATVAVVLLATHAALKAYTAFLAFRDRARQGRDETLTQTIELMHADGSWERKTITYSAASEPISEAALRELSTLPGLDTVVGTQSGS